MEKFVTGALLRLIGLLVDGRILEHIQGLVLAFMNVDDLDGPAKKQAVTENVNALEGDLGRIAADMGGWLLSTAIDVAHAYLVTRAER